MLRQFQNLIYLTRPQNSISVITAVAVGYSWLVKPELHPMSVAMLVMLLVNSSATISNDIADMQIDRVNKRSSPLIRGEVSIALAQKFSLLLLLSALLITAFYFPYPAAITTLCVSIIFSWAYNNAPIYASRRPILSIIILAGCVGLCTVLFGAFSRNLDPRLSIYILALGWFLQRASLVPYKDFKDYTGDKLSKKDTFLVHFGVKTTKLTSIVLGLVGIACIAVACALESDTAALVWVLLYGLVILGHRLINSSTKTMVENSQVFVKAIVIANVFEIGLVLWLII